MTEADEQAFLTDQFNRLKTPGRSIMTARRLAESKLDSRINALLAQKRLQAAKKLAAVAKQTAMAKPTVGSVAASRSAARASRKGACDAKKTVVQRGGQNTAASAAVAKTENSMNALAKALSVSANESAKSLAMSGGQGGNSVDQFMETLKGGYRMYGGQEQSSFEKAIADAEASAPMTGGQGEPLAPHQQAVISAADTMVADAEKAAAAAAAAAAAPSVGGRRRTYRTRRH